jgi:hypothetical protein
MAHSRMLLSHGVGSGRAGAEDKARTTSSHHLGGRKGRASCSGEAKAREAARAKLAAALRLLSSTATAHLPEPRSD